jgi:hypothetical protein
MSHRERGSWYWPPARAAWTAFAAIGLVAGWMPASIAKVETWRQEGPTAFAKARRAGVVISDAGRVRLGHAISPCGSLKADRVWDLAQGRGGVLFAATGDAGKVFRRDATTDAVWTLVFDSSDSQALSLVACPDGTVFAGTGPSGNVVNITDPKHPASRPDPQVQYIWDLACDSQGNLFAATGPLGQLWKRARDGKWTLLYDSKAAHLLSLAIGPDDAIYAGSDGEGLIYRVTRDGKATILFDAPQAEIRTLLWGADGALYAGTAAEAGGASSTRGSVFLSQGATPQLLDSAQGERGVDAASRTGNEIPSSGLAVQTPPRPAPPTRQPPARPSGGGSAAPKPITAGDNAVYRLDADGVPREILRAKALFHALAWANDRLLAGTGPEGQLYEIREHGQDTAPLAKLDNGQILALLAQPDGTVMLGTGDPGSVARLAAGFAAEGELVSEVHDTKLVSRFGSLTWRADQPPGTSVVFQARSGNVNEPDETWSAWSAAQSNPDAASIGAPSGRFLQYRAKLSTNDPKRTPELRSVSLSYRTSNLAPEITRLEVPDLSAADGAARQPRLNIRWDATDPNDDDLRFTLKVRKEGWPEWIQLTEEPITEKTFAWDTTAFPSGSYRLMLVASDRLSNSPGDALVRDRESVTFIVDHDPPSVQVTPRGRGAVINLKDDLTRLVKADYALDGGAWTPIFPDDGLFDTSAEKITLSLPDLKPGAHLIMVRATDSAGNVGTGDALVDLKE